MKGIRETPDGVIIIITIPCCGCGKVVKRGFIL